MHCIAILHQCKAFVKHTCPIQEAFCSCCVLMEMTSSSWETQLSCFLHAAVRRLHSTQSYTLTTEGLTKTLILAQRALNSCSSSWSPCGYNNLRSLPESWVLSHRRYCWVSSLFLHQFTLLDYSLRRLAVNFQGLFGTVGSEFWTEESSLLQICVPPGNSPKFKRDLEKRFNVCRVRVQFWLWLGTAFALEQQEFSYKGAYNIRSISWVIYIINSFRNISLIYHSNCTQCKDSSNPRPPYPNTSIPLGCSTSG